MKPQRFEEPSVSERLRNHSVPKGAVGQAPGPAFLFAFVFLFFGVAITLGTRGFFHHERHAKSSDWPWSVMGISFCIIGSAALFLAFAALRERRRCQLVAIGLSEMRDFAWDQTKFEVSGWQPFYRAAGFAIFVTIFLVPFNGFAFAPAGEWRSNLLAKIAISIFDMVSLALWFKAVKELLRARKFGSSRIEFSRFPFRVGNSVALRFVPPANITALNRSAFTFRCVEEWTECHGSGENRSCKTIQEAKWTGTWHLDDARAFMPGEKIDLAFDPPAYTLPTSLSGPRTIYWELVVKLDVPGLDFEGLYLVPVY